MKFSKMVKDDIDKVLELCNLTEDEEEVFILLSKGYTRIQIENDLSISSSTIGRIKNRIEDKIKRI